MVLEDEEGLWGWAGPYFTEASVSSTSHQFHSSSHRPTGGEPEVKTAVYLKEQIRAWFKRYSSSSFWRVQEGSWESAQEVSVCFVDLYLWSCSYGRNFWTDTARKGRIVLFAASSTAVQTELCSISIWKLTLIFFMVEIIQQSVHVSALSDRQAIRFRRLKN